MFPSGKIAEALSKCDEEEIPSQPPPELPIIEDFQHKYFRADRFLDLDVLFIQHHLGPFIPKLRAMIEDGLDPYRCWFVDIPYSTNDLVVRELTAVGFPEDQMTDRFNLSGSNSSKLASIRSVNSSREIPRSLLRGNSLNPN